jgi:integrase
LSLLTGARKANVLAMRWEEVNLERHAWRIPDTKNGESLTLPLSTEACAILKYRFEKRINDFVFPGTGKTAHMISPKKGWKRVLDRITLHDVIELVGDAQNRTRDQIEEMQQAARADERRALSTYKAIAKGLSIDISGVGLKNLRIHDLRRTLGSWQAATGASLAIIGKSLGHKDVSTTAIYARLSLDPVRQAMETATSAMLRAGGVGSDADVIMLSLPTRVPLRA